MIDKTRVLRPLQEAEAAIEKLDHYESQTDLAAALQTTWQAIDRTLRNLLRADPGAPDDVRLGALSPADVPPDRLVAALRQRNLISLQLAGMIHEMDQSARRMAQGEVRPADGDHARSVVDVLRAEVNAAADKPVQTATHTAIESGMLDLPAHPVPAPKARQRYRMAAIVAGILVLMLILIAVILHQSDLEKGIAAFQAQDWREAERNLTKDAENGDPTAQLYLARVYRTTQQYQRAAAVLRKAATTHENDDDIQRELGKLFLDLNQPANAVRYLQKARQLQPEDPANWQFLVRGMRAAGDPNAERVLQEAPPEVRAALSRQ
jgi:tetratricopeptide (TPR) repeat protein